MAEYNIPLPVINLTKKLMQHKSLVNPEVLKIREEINDRNFKNIVRFNPSIINLHSDLYLMSYRIWNDTNIAQDKYPLTIKDDGHPWKSGWNPHWGENKIKDCDIKFLRPNMIGLCVIKIDLDNLIKYDIEKLEGNYNWEQYLEVIHDQILNVDCSNDGGEDARLFEDKDNNIRLLINTENKKINNEIIFPNINDGNSKRYIATINLGNKRKILNEIWKDINDNNELIDINYIFNEIKGKKRIDNGIEILDKIKTYAFEYEEEYGKQKVLKVKSSDKFVDRPGRYISAGSTIVLCPEIHEGAVEKNLVPYTNNNQNYLSYFTMPNGNPIKTYNVITYDDQTLWTTDKKYDDDMKYARQNLIHPYSFETKISLCSRKKKEFSVNLFDDINNIYDLTNTNQHIIKFSGGTNGIKLNDKEHIAIGHIVINVKKMRQIYNTITNGIDENNHTEIIKNLINQNLLRLGKNNNDKEIDFIYNNILDIKNRKIEDNLDDIDIDDPNYKGYRLHHYTAIYYMYIYTFDSNTSEIKRISNAFVPPTSIDTGVIFPCGIEIKNNNLLISYGETDSLIKIAILNMNVFNKEEYLKLYDINEIKSYNYQFINFAKNYIPKPKIINQIKHIANIANIGQSDIQEQHIGISGGNSSSINNVSYYDKYIKYKNKYISLKKQYFS